MSPRKPTLPPSFRSSPSEGTGSDEFTGQDREDLTRLLQKLTPETMKQDGELLTVLISIFKNALGVGDKTQDMTPADGRSQFMAGSAPSPDMERSGREPALRERELALRERELEQRERVLALRERELARRERGSQGPEEEPLTRGAAQGQFEDTGRGGTRESYNPVHHFQHLPHLDLRHMGPEYQGHADRLYLTRETLIKEYAPYENNLVTKVEILGTASDPENRHARVAIKDDWTDTGEAKMEPLHVRVTRQDGSVQEGYVELGGYQRGGRKAGDTGHLLIGHAYAPDGTKKGLAGGDPMSPMRQLGEAYAKALITKETITSFPELGDRYGFIQLGRSQTQTGADLGTTLELTLQSNLNSLNLPEHIVRLHDRPPAGSVLMTDITPSENASEAGRLAVADAGHGGGTMSPSSTIPGGRQSGRSMSRGSQERSQSVSGPGTLPTIRTT